MSIKLFDLNVKVEQGLPEYPGNTVTLTDKAGRTVKRHHPIATVPAQAVAWAIEQYMREFDPLPVPEACNAADAPTDMHLCARFGKRFRALRPIRRPNKVPPGAAPRHQVVLPDGDESGGTHLAACNKVLQCRCPAPLSGELCCFCCPP